MLEYLRKQGVSPQLLAGVEKYRAQYPWTENLLPLQEPHYRFFGKEIWEQALAALLAGENLLLAGNKAAGKNVLAENLAYVFGRYNRNISFHINMDASLMLGTDTFQKGEVVFRPGPVYQCAQEGSFGILDEINMARNEALASLHAILDYRRRIDIPGYGSIALHPATRFVATMNYGYAGTRELNEALASRFVVIQLPDLTEQVLEGIMEQEYPDLDTQIKKNLAGLFLDLQLKCQQGEISSKAVDLRGLFGAIAMYQQGLSLKLAIELGMVNKVFNEEERQLLEDLLSLRISD